MRKTILLAGMLCIGYASAQKGSVGINTTEPKASLHIERHTGIPATNPQGVLLPHLTQEQRNAFDKDQLTKGLMIFNTSKNCIDWWNGTQWVCTDGTQKDDHGDEYAIYRASFEYKATEKFTKNNCPTGQKGSSITYAPQQTIIGKGSSNVSMEDARKQAEANAKAEFARLGQEEANTKGSCYQPIGRCQYLIDKNPDGQWVLLNGRNSVKGKGKGDFDYKLLENAQSETLELAYFKGVRLIENYFYDGNVWATRCTQTPDDELYNQHQIWTDVCVLMQKGTYKSDTPEMYGKQIKVIYPAFETCDVNNNIPNNGTGNFGENSFIWMGPYT